MMLPRSAWSVLLVMFIAPGALAAAPAPEAETDRAGFLAWQKQTRDELSRMLGIPDARVLLDAEKRSQFEAGGILVEKWIFTSEPGSRVPALLYRPKHAVPRMPAVVLTYGHGGSKSGWQYVYAAQVFARLGLACLTIDPIGEEERTEGRHGHARA